MGKRTALDFHVDASYNACPTTEPDKYSCFCHSCAVGVLFSTRITSSWSNRLFSFCIRQATLSEVHCPYIAGRAIATLGGATGPRPLTGTRARARLFAAG